MLQDSVQSFITKGHSSAITRKGESISSSKSVHGTNHSQIAMYKMTFCLIFGTNDYEFEAKAYFLITVEVSKVGGILDACG